MKLSEAKLGDRVKIKSISNYDIEGVVAGTEYAYAVSGSVPNYVMLASSQPNSKLFTKNSPSTYRLVFKNILDDKSLTYVSYELPDKECELIPPSKEEPMPISSFASTFLIDPQQATVGGAGAYDIRVGGTYSTHTASPTYEPHAGHPHAITTTQLEDLKAFIAQHNEDHKTSDTNDYWKQQDILLALAFKTSNSSVLDALSMSGDTEVRVQVAASGCTSTNTRKRLMTDADYDVRNAATNSPYTTQEMLLELLLKPKEPKPVKEPEVEVQETLTSIQEEQPEEREPSAAMIIGATFVAGLVGAAIKSSMSSPTARVADITIEDVAEIMMEAEEQATS